MGSVITINLDRQHFEVRTSERGAPYESERRDLVFEWYNKGMDKSDWLEDPLMVITRESKYLKLVEADGEAFESWEIDLETFGMEITLNKRVVSEHVKKLEFVEKEPEQPFKEEPGLKRFLRDASLSGDESEEEVAFLRTLRFKTKRPTPLYYYRELQNLRDPLHFRSR